MKRTLGFVKFILQFTMSFLPLANVYQMLQCLIHMNILLRAPDIGELFFTINVISMKCTPYIAQFFHNVYI